MFYLKALFVVVKFQSDPGRLYLRSNVKSFASRANGNKLRDVDGFKFPLRGVCSLFSILLLLLLLGIL